MQLNRSIQQGIECGLPTQDRVAHPRPFLIMHCTKPSFTWLWLPRFEYQRLRFEPVLRPTPPPFSKAQVQPILSLIVMHLGSIRWASAFVVMDKSATEAIASLTVLASIEIVLDEGDCRKKALDTANALWSASHVSHWGAHCAACMQYIGRYLQSRIGRFWSALRRDFARRDLHSAKGMYISVGLLTSHSEGAPAAHRHLS